MIRWGKCNYDRDRYVTFALFGRWIALQFRTWGKPYLIYDFGRL